MSELQRAHSPLQHSGFEREFGNYPSKAFLTWLLDPIDNGVFIRYSGPHTPHTAPKLISARCHPEVIDEVLQKELQSGQTYKNRLLSNLR